MLPHGPRSAPDASLYHGHLVPLALPPQWGSAAAPVAPECEGPASACNWRECENKRSGGHTHCCTSAAGVTLTAILTAIQVQQGLHSEQRGSHLPLYKCSGGHTHCCTSAVKVILTAIQVQQESHSPLYKCSGAHIHCCTSEAGSHSLLYKCSRGHTQSSEGHTHCYRQRPTAFLSSSPGQEDKLHLNLSS